MKRSMEGIGLRLPRAQGVQGLKDLGVGRVSGMAMEILDLYSGLNQKLALKLHLRRPSVTKIPR